MTDMHRANRVLAAQCLALATERLQDVYALVAQAKRAAMDTPMYDLLDVSVRNTRSLKDQCSAIETQLVGGAA